MGAFDYDSFNNDSAMDWISNEIQPMLIDKIRKKLSFFLECGFDDDVEKQQAEAAAALLVLLSRPIKSIEDLRLPINLFYLAKEDNTIDMAVSVISKLLNGKVWINDWSEPEEKIFVLQELLHDLRKLKEAP
ncbi:MAG TPA: DUF4259 domain-containing protein [Gemmataceae bacterium]|jgi:hypothetical protein